MIRPDAGSLAQLLQGLKQARRDLADQMVAQVIAEPARLLPDAGVGTIAAIEVVLAEDQGGGE